VNFNYIWLKNPKIKVPSKRKIKNKKKKKRKLLKKMMKKKITMIRVTKTRQGSKKLTQWTIMTKLPFSRL